MLIVIAMSVEAFRKIKDCAEVLESDTDSDSKLGTKIHQEVDLEVGNKVRTAPPQPATYQEEQLTGGTFWHHRNIVW